MSDIPEEKQVSDTTEEQEVSAEEKKVSEEMSKPVKVKKSAEEKQADIELAQQQMLAATERKKAEAAMTKKTMDKLVEQFPSAITKNAADIKPLMIGTLQEIMAKLEKPFHKKGVLLALTAYCSATEYLQATIDQTHRIDLDGNPVQEILELHKQVAVKKLDEREKKRVQQEELKRRQQANIEAAEAKKAAAAKKATEAPAEKVAKVPAEKIAKAAKAPAAEKEAKPKKVESKPVTVVVKTKKAEPATTTVIIKTKKIEVPPVSAPSTTAAATESETGEPVRKKLSLKSKAEKS